MTFLEADPVLLIADPVWVQHLLWLLRYPETWAYLAMWALVVFAAFSLAARLRRAGKAAASAAVLIGFAFLVASYVWLAFRTRRALVEGDLSLAPYMGHANSALMLAALASGVWLVMLRRKRR